MAQEISLENTLISRIDNMDINMMTLAQDLKDLNLLNLIDGIQVSSNRKVLEIYTQDENAKRRIITEGINTQNYYLQFSTQLLQYTNVSFFNIPMEIPDDLVAQELSKYGEIHGGFRVKKRLLGKVIYNGTRVYQYKKINNHIPRFIRLFGRMIKVQYTGQPESFRQNKQQENEKAVTKNIPQEEPETNPEPTQNENQEEEENAQTTEQAEPMDEVLEVLEEGEITGEKQINTKEKKKKKDEPSDSENIPIDMITRETLINLCHKQNYNFKRIPEIKNKLNKREGTDFMVSMLLLSYGKYYPGDFVKIEERIPEEVKQIWIKSKQTQEDIKRKIDKYMEKIRR